MQKWHRLERTELPNQENIRMLNEEKTYQYLEILEVEMKEKYYKEYL